MADVEHVNERDEVIGIVPFDEIFTDQLIARIARVFLLDQQSRIYLQRRSTSMRNAPGLWDQSAAGHVDPGESYEQAAARELEEELGVENVKLNQKVYYYAEEPHPTYGPLKRFNTIYVAKYDGQPIVHDPEEVMDGRWINFDELESWIEQKPDDFAPGFLTAYKKYKEAK